ncbi:MAG: HAD-IB family hydrolase [Rhodospirillaceae bacterium]
MSRRHFGRGLYPRSKPFGRWTESRPENAENEVGAGIALFDFDGTLIAGDSLPAFLIELGGRVRLGCVLLPAVIGALVGHLIGRPPGVDLRGSIKALLLRSTLAGVPIAEIEAAARRLKERLRWLEPQVDVLKAHAAAGRRIVVASGALDIYLRILLEGLPVHDIMATAMEIRDGVVTGRLAGENCVRAAKAEQVQAYLAAYSGRRPSWGYGNRPDDLAMLALVDHPTVV